MNRNLHLRRGPLACALLLLCALLLGARTGRAQVDTYAFAASAGTFVPLAATATTVTSINSDDAVTGALPIGFSFVFDGTPFTQVYANSNGFLSFNATTPGSGSYTNGLATATADYRPLAAPYWDDLTGVGGTASYLTTGTAPNRTFTFEWLNWRRLSASGPQLSFQVQLVEGSNVVRFVYRPEATAMTGASVSIGLAGAGTGSGSFLSLSNATATAAVSSATETSTIATVPVAGQTYSFTPPVPSLCPTPRNLAATVTNTTAALSFTVANATPGPFTLLYGPTGFNPALPASATNVYTTVTTAATTVNLTGLPPQTAYQFYVRQNCGGTNGNSAFSNVGAFTTNPNPPANDDCAGALNVPIQFGSCVGQTSADNTAATNSTGVSAPTCANYQGKDIWFKVTVPASGSVTVKTLAPTGGSAITDTGMSIYSGTCGTLTDIGCNDDGSGAFSLLTLTGRTPGEVLYIRVWAYGGNNIGLIAVCATSPSNCGVPIAPTSSNLANTTATLSWTAPAGGLPAGSTYELEYGLQGYVQGTGTSIIGLTTNSYALTGLQPSTAYCYYVRQNCGTTNGSSTFVGPTCFTTPLTAPANDDPCGAIALTTTTRNGSNVGATTSGQNGINLPACSPAQLPKDVWFAFTASAATTTLTLAGPAAGMVRVYTSPSCSAGPFTSVFCAAATAANTGFPAPIPVTGLVAGTRYYVAVSGYGSSDTPGTFTLAATNVLATKAQTNSSALLVFPNPSSTGQLTLALNGLSGAGQATLLNALGQVVLEKALSGAAEQALSTRGLATGVYTLRVAVAGQVLTRKIVLD